VIVEGSLLEVFFFGHDDSRFDRRMRTRALDAA